MYPLTRGECLNQLGLTSSGDAIAAREAFTLALSLTPKDDQLDAVSARRRAFVGRAAAHRATDDLEGALRDLDDAKALDPDPSVGLPPLPGVINRMCHQSNAPAARVALTPGCQVGYMDHTGCCINRILQNNVAKSGFQPYPSDPAAHNNRPSHHVRIFGAQLFQELGRHEEAVACYIEGIALIEAQNGGQGCDATFQPLVDLAVSERALSALYVNVKVGGGGGSRNKEGREEGSSQGSQGGGKGEGVDDESSTYSSYGTSVSGDGEVDEEGVKVIPKTWLARSIEHLVGRCKLNSVDPQLESDWFKKEPLPLNINPGFKMCLSNQTCATTTWSGRCRSARATYAPRSTSA
jgi:hypothetical protein